jgi:hypothetical protein
MKSEGKRPIGTSEVDAISGNDVIYFTDIFDLNSFPIRKAFIVGKSRGRYLTRSAEGYIWTKTL